MLKLSVCAETVYCHENFNNRIEKISKIGINAIEFWQWNNKDLKDIHNKLEQNNVNLLGFCIDSENPDISKFISGTALNTTFTDKLLIAVRESIDVAKRLGASNLIITVGNNISDLTYEQQIKNVICNLKAIKDCFEKERITLLVEPINLSERPSYLIPNAKNLIPIIKEISSDYVKILYDIYHQNMEGDFSIDDLKSALPYIGHIHVADYPGRGEPGTGNINYSGIFNMLAKEKYDKYIGFEFFSKNPEDIVFDKLLKNIQTL